MNKLRSSEWHDSREQDDSAPAPFQKKKKNTTETCINGNKRWTKQKRKVGI